MAKIIKTASGKRIDMDNLILRNENVIAIGNTKKNARGDQLGPGGKIIKTRDQIMKDYYALNTPIATESPQTVQSVTRLSQTTSGKTPIVVPVEPESGLDAEEFDSAPIEKN